MRRYLSLFVLLFCGLLLYADIKNRDKPAKGEWDFRMEKIWEIEKAGDEIFGHPFSMTVSDEGMLYVFDTKNGTNVFPFEQLHHQRRPHLCCL